MGNLARIAIVLLAGALGVWAWWAQALSAPDRRTLQMTVISPDGSLEARVYSNVWAGLLTLGTDKEQSVEIARVGQQAVAAPPPPDTLARFNMDSGHVVAVLWRGAQQLVIVVSADARPVGMLRSVEGIRPIVVHHDPHRSKHTACVDAFDRAVAAGPVATPPAQCSFWTVRSTSPSAGGDVSQTRQGRLGVGGRFRGGGVRWVTSMA